MRLHTKNAEPHLLPHNSLRQSQGCQNGGCVFTEVKTHPCRCLNIELCGIAIVSHTFKENNSVSLKCALFSSLLV